MSLLSRDGKVVIKKKSKLSAKNIVIYAKKKIVIKGKSKVDGNYLEMDSPGHIKVGKKVKFNIAE